MRKHSSKKTNRFKSKAQRSRTQETIAGIKPKDFITYIRQAEKEALPIIKEIEAEASAAIFLLGKYVQALLATNRHLLRRSISDIINNILDLWQTGTYQPGSEYPFTLEETLLDITRSRGAKRDYSEYFQEFRPGSPSPAVGLGKIAGGVLLHPKTRLWQIWIILDSRHIFLGAYDDSDRAQKLLEDIVNAIRAGKEIDVALSTHQVDGEPQQIPFGMMTYLVENMQRYIFFL